MLFHFKQQPADFCVDEILYPMNQSAEGSVFYLRFQKESLNTMDVIAYICEHTGLNRRQLGISGLKDKKAITTQRLSIAQHDLDGVGISEFLAIVSDKVTIIETYRSDQMLGIGQHAANRFTIRLRANDSISTQVKQLLGESLGTMSKYGFPNTFGQQRFGKRNIQRSQEFFDLDHVPDPAENYHLKLKLQAFPSLRFNALAMQRYEAGDLLVGGDILVRSERSGARQYGVYRGGKGSIDIFDYADLKNIHSNDPYFSPHQFIGSTSYTSDRSPTGLMLGGRILLADAETTAGEYETGILEQSGFLPLREQLARAYHLWGYRRPLWIIPEEVEIIWDGDDCLLSFSLPVGAYATTLLGWVFRDIDRDTVQRCGWNIELP